MLAKALEKFKASADRQAKIILGEIVDKAPEEVQKSRMDICLSCEKLYKPTMSCKLCGCFMNYKTWMAKQSCPLQKWTAYKKEDEIIPPANESP